MLVSDIVFYLFVDCIDFCRGSWLSDGHGVLRAEAGCMDGCR